MVYIPNPHAGKVYAEMKPRCFPQKLNQNKAKICVGATIPCLLRAYPSSLPLYGYYGKVHSKS